jgi:hypothetical protein|tara:strand:- start:157 stop:345 length:189 start_codon:yes stop_codon:yes gene_type:complete
MNEEFQADYNVALTAADVNLLHHCIKETIKNWPGGDAVEQEHLIYLRDSMYRMILETRYNNS